jgi:hypothetical protein
MGATLESRKFVTTKVVLERVVSPPRDIRRFRFASSVAGGTLMRLPVEVYRVSGESQSSSVPSGAFRQAGRVNRESPAKVTELPWVAAAKDLTRLPELYRRILSAVNNAHRVPEAAI